ncbi:hypothetical protein [Ruminococcus sp.]|uniref:hypothetical protein n=1 Tax=Ruminococcus sp. TaxID=41978 RepID=UPI0025F0A699|nr:hypothetical protein [Ruminococcus sp.]MCR4639074.1 hypothetical protein [Ruminococcus sp.]
MKKTIKRAFTIIAASATLLVSGASMTANAAHNHCCCCGTYTRVIKCLTGTHNVVGVYSKCCGHLLWTYTT